MGSSLVRFASTRKTSGDKKLFWGRINQDGLPFRGDAAPMLTEDEYETRINRVADAKNAFFDVRDTEQNAKFLQVMECAFNGWYKIVHLERFWRKTTEHYVEWIEYYLEDGSPSPYTSNGIMELANGSANFAGGAGAYPG